MRTLAPLVFLLLATEASAKPNNAKPPRKSTSPEILDLPCLFTSGQKVAGHLDQTHTTTRGVVTSDQDFTITVLETTPTASTIEWRYGQATIRANWIEAEVPDFVAKMETFVDEYRVVLVTNVRGNPVRVSNLDEVQAAGEEATKALRAALQAIPATPREAERREEILLGVAAPLSGPLLEASTLRRSEQFFMTVCGSVPLGDPVTAILERPNPYDGEPVPWVASRWVSAYDRAAGTATVETEVTVDADSARLLTDSALEAMLSPLFGGAMPLDTSHVPPTGVRMHSIAETTLDSPWPRRVEHVETTTLFGGPELSDRFVYTME